MISLFIEKLIMTDNEKLFEDQKAEILIEMEKQNSRLLNVLGKSYNILTEKVEDLKTHFENLKKELVDWKETD